MKYQSRSETGQVLIILALVLVGLLAFTALAVDGGMVLADRRTVQNAADAAALGGAGAAAQSLERSGVINDNFTCALSSVGTAVRQAIATAIQSARANGFTIDNNLTDGMGVNVTCRVEDKGSYKDKYLDVHTVISSVTSTSFAQIIFNKPLKNTVEAIARIRPRTYLEYGYAITALSDSCGNGTGGLYYDGGGTGSTQVHGGGIFSNSCITTNGGINLTVDNTDQGIHYVAGFEQNGGGSSSITPAPTQLTQKLPVMDVPAPDCASLDDYAGVSGTSIPPGHYDEIKTNGDLTLEPGLYCVRNGFDVRRDLTGEGVTIYMEGGDFSVTAQANVDLSAPTTDAPPAIKNMVIYMAVGNTGTISMEGSAISKYAGTVFAPSGSIDVGGNSSELETINTQLIGYNVKLHGNVTIDINFNGKESYTRSPQLELNR